MIYRVSRVVVSLFTESGAVLTEVYEPTEPNGTFAVSIERDSGATKSELGGVTVRLPRWPKSWSWSDRPEQ